ncbi:hypothetical protein BJV82DRAFT_628945 [Fennellomyces sp. T-0311]|nr:hypothetical protein BJV82DRAFT_628945 [Fennellomyces sp. T-0311]
MHPHRQTKTNPYLRGSEGYIFPQTATQVVWPNGSRAIRLEFFSDNDDAVVRLFFTLRRYENLLIRARERQGDELSWVRVRITGHGRTVYADESRNVDRLLYARFITPLPPTPELSQEIRDRARAFFGDRLEPAQQQNASPPSSVSSGESNIVIVDNDAEMALLDDLMNNNPQVLAHVADRVATVFRQRMEELVDHVLQTTRLPPPSDRSSTFASSQETASSTASVLSHTSASSHPQSQAARSSSVCSNTSASSHEPSRALPSSSASVRSHTSAQSQEPSQTARSPSTSVRSHASTQSQQVATQPEEEPAANATDVDDNALVFEGVVLEPLEPDLLTQHDSMRHSLPPSMWSDGYDPIVQYNRQADQGSRQERSQANQPDGRANQLVDQGSLMNDQANQPGEQANQFVHQANRRGEAVDTEPAMDATGNSVEKEDPSTSKGYEKVFGLLRDDFIPKNYDHIQDRAVRLQMYYRDNYNNYQRRLAEEQTQAGIQYAFDPNTNQPIQLQPEHALPQAQPLPLQSNGQLQLYQSLQNLVPQQQLSNLPLDFQPPPQVLQYVPNTMATTSTNSSTPGLPQDAQNYLAMMLGITPEPGPRAASSAPAAAFDATGMPGPSNAPAPDADDEDEEDAQQHTQHQ